MKASKVNQDLSAVFSLTRAALLVFLVCFYFSVAAEAQQKPTRQSSLEAFSKGNFEKAYSELSELLILYPGDPMYKYYAGRCLVNLKREPEKAVELLSGARQSTSAVRSIPQDVVFWLGRAQQMAGMFNEAARSYNSYTAVAGKKAAKDAGVPEFLEESSQHKGSLQSSKPEAKRVMPEKKNEIPPSEKKDTAAVQNTVKAVAPSGAPGESIRQEYDIILSEAMKYQVQADSLGRIAELQKKGLDTLDYRTKSALRNKIASTEKVADSLQKIADVKFNSAQDMMNKTPFVRITESKEPDAGEKTVATKKDTLKTNSGKPFRPPSVVLPETQSIKKEPVKPVTGKPPADSSVTNSVKLFTAPVQKPAGVFSYFEILQKPVYKADEKVLVDPGIPSGLIYRIQVAVFRNPVAPSYFTGITPVFGFKSVKTGITTYYAGMFRKLSDAGKALASVRQKGFKDAFTSSFLDGKQVSAERASLLEKEWGNKPFTSMTGDVDITPADTLPPALAFRVEVMRSSKPVKDDVIEGMRKTAGTRGFEIINTEDGNQIFLIGTFITYESAEEYADLLIRNGYRDAKVGAWLGRKEIPLETARQLFEKIE